MFEVPCVGFIFLSVSSKSRGGCVISHQSRHLKNKFGLNIGCRKSMNHKNKGSEAPLDLVHRLSPVHRTVSADSDLWWGTAFSIILNAALVGKHPILLVLFSSLCPLQLVSITSAMMSRSADCDPAICVRASGDRLVSQRKQTKEKKAEINLRIFAGTPIKSPINAHLQWPQLIVSNPPLFLMGVELTGCGETSRPCVHQ